MEEMGGPGGECTGETPEGLEKIVSLPAIILFIYLLSFFSISM